MSTFDKLEALFSQKPPRNDIDIDQADCYLSKKGYKLVRTRGSHRVYKCPNRPDLVIPLVNGRYIKSGYIKEIRKALEL